MLELRKLLDNVEAMSEEIARRQGVYGDLAKDARRALMRYAVVDEDLLEKIEKATSQDLSWRGARPVGNRLDERHKPQTSRVDASLVAVDGSQIYPDRHGLALYFLINIGTMILRQGSGDAPDVNTRPQVFFHEEDVYNDDKELIDNRVVNAIREMAELHEMADQAQKERAHWGGDLERLVVALMDGPLLIWIGEKEMNTASVRQRIDAYISELVAIQNSEAIPVGYVDRPHSANVLRLLHVADLNLMDINQDTIRSTRYRSLTDRVLFSFLAPNERSAIFSSTAQINSNHFKEAGQEIVFFYMNVSPSDQVEDARIVRVDVPAWVVAQPRLLDHVQQAVYHDCEGTGYPYVLARAHELALVTHRERQDLEHMLAATMLRKGLLPESSQKAFLKQLL